MGLLFSRLSEEPVFLKQSSSAESQLEKLIKIKPSLNLNGQAVVEHDIKCLEYGIAGEKNIEFELKNSHMPMYILHDVYLKCGELSAQIDYLVFTRKVCFVIECKNLFGNIEINNNGDFIRTIEYNGKKKREGIYSPITQNERHLELIKSIVLSKQKSFISKYVTKKVFDKSFVSIVVLANPKTIVNNRFAKKDIKNKVIRADKLIQYIKDVYNKSDIPASSDSETKEWAESFLAKSCDNEIDYTVKYERFFINNVDENNSNYEALFNELKGYRLKKSRQEQIKPYFIYNNYQLEALIHNAPKSLDELKQISGFGEKKAEKYGKDILNILSKYD